MNVVVLPGELTIATVAEVRPRLLAAVSDGAAGPVEVDLDGVEELDTAGVQLLLALRREAGLAGRGLSVRAWSPVVAGTLLPLGLDPADLGELAPAVTA